MGSRAVFAITCALMFNSVALHALQRQKQHLAVLLSENVGRKVSVHDVEAIFSRQSRLLLEQREVAVASSYD